MSNKTSDKNVGDVEVIKDFILELKEFELNKDTLEIANAIENILAEREQKDKRIQKLEEESEILEFQNKQVENYAEELKKYNKTVSDRMVEYKKNSISKQAITNALNRHKFAYEELSKDYDNTHYEDDEIRTRDFYMIVAEDRIVQVLQELLEGGK